MIRHLLGFNISMPQDFTAWAIIEERKGKVCILSENMQHKCPGCSAYREFERVPWKNYVYCSGML